MLFEFYYDDRRYLVNLEHFDENHTEPGMEVFRIRHSDDPDSWEDYEIVMFREENENLTRVKATELPKAFQEMMGEELEKVMPKTFVANPYFDELMIFFGNTILTSKDRFGAIICDQCGKKNLYEKKGKDTKTDYIQDLQAKLKANPNPEWPFKGRLLVQFFVSDKQSRLNVVDLDNLAKTVLDTFKGVVFKDDAQVVSLVASKEWVQGIVASMVAIKQLEPDEKPKFQDFLFSGRQKAWKEEYKAKIALGKPTRFARY